MKGIDRSRLKVLSIEYLDESLILETLNVEPWNFEPTASLTYASTTMVLPYARQVVLIHCDA